MKKELEQGAHWTNFRVVITDLRKLIKDARESILFERARRKGHCLAQTPDSDSLNSLQAPE